MRPKAYSYIRFSTAEQIKGDSLRRQTQLSEEYAIAHGLDLDTTMSLSDLGISAYNGNHIERGALGVFLESVDKGLIKPGSYLLIENFDRLSRQKINISLTLFMSILQKGIIVVTLSDGRKYDSDIDFMEVMISLVSMSRAHEESARKGDMVKKAWDNKKLNIDIEKLTKWSPKWLDLSDDRTKFFVNEERAEIVRTIFDWAANGLGTTLILRQIEELGIQPWGCGSGIKTGKRAPKRWHGSYIQRVLTGRQVLGEFKLRNSKDGQTYEVIKGYFPKIISEELYYKVQSDRSARIISMRGGGRKGKTISNLFSKVAKCGYSIDGLFREYRCDGDNETMLFVNKGAKYPIKYLQCSRAKDGSTGCKKCGQVIRYDDFENSFLKHVYEIDVSAIVGTDIEADNELDELQNVITIREGELNNAKSELNNYRSASKSLSNISQWMIDQSNEYQAIIDKYPPLIEKLIAKYTAKQSDHQQSKQTKSKMIDLIKMMATANEDGLFKIRVQLAQIIKTYISSIEVYSSGRVIEQDYFDRVLRERGPNALKKEMQYHDEVYTQRKIREKCFYVVNYKSGEIRIVKLKPSHH